MLASCLIWIGGISLAIVCFMGTAVTTGWIMAGALLIALAIWVIVMAKEIHNAIELPDFFSSDVADKSAHSIERSVRPMNKDIGSEGLLFARSNPNERRRSSRCRGRLRKTTALPRRPAPGR